MSPLGFKTRGGAWGRHTYNTFFEIHLWCNTCLPFSFIPFQCHWLDAANTSPCPWSTDDVGAWQASYTSSSAEGCNGTQSSIITLSSQYMQLNLCEDTNNAAGIDLLNPLFQWSDKRIRHGKSEFSCNSCLWSFLSKSTTQIIPLNHSSLTVGSQ